MGGEESEGVRRRNKGSWTWRAGLVVEVWNEYGKSNEWEEGKGKQWGKKAKGNWEKRRDGVVGGCEGVSRKKF